MDVTASSPEERLARARDSLEGLSVGDAFGIYVYYRSRKLPTPKWYWTDDTNMAMSIYSVLRTYGEINQDALAATFASHYDVDLGYGPAMDDLLRSITYGEPWRRTARGLFGGQGSFGNGSAMRVAPVGAYFADDLDLVVRQAHLSAEVTHMHPEAVAGAIAVAVATAVAWQCRESNTPSRPEFLDRVLPYIPDGVVKGQSRHARDLVQGVSVRDAVEALGNGSKISCQDTVPFVLWCAGEALYDYEEALWLCGEGRGDRDTTCATVGGIVVMHSGIESVPVEWINRRQPLADWAFEERIAA